MTTNDWREEYQLLLDEIATDFPDFEVIKKSDSTLMGVINILLRIITFNQMQSFMTAFTTTLGNTVYVPDSWDDATTAKKWTTLSHERVHMEQAKRYGRFVFSFLYALCLPVIFAFYRTKFEKEAYEVSLRCKMRVRGPDSFTPALKKFFVDHFTTGQYFWMWVKRSDIEEWYDETVARVLEEEDWADDPNRVANKEDDA